MIAWALLAWCSLAYGGEHRFGLFVGNNEGMAEEAPLLFAERDAEKMRDLFVKYGGMEQRNSALLLGSSGRVLYNEFDRLAAKIGPLVRDGHEVVFVFFYSGHGDDEAMHLGPSRFDYNALRVRLEKTGAQVRVAMVDACQSGGLVRRKGGQRGPAMDLAAPVVESMRGTAIITSSAVSELSQESTEIGGGFFTHYLHSALLGAADRNRDGEVNLSEAYDYVHVETTFSTREAPEAQTPHGDFDLSGAGSVRLTRFVNANARIAFLGDLDGEYSVWDQSNKRYVAQVSGSQPLALAVQPGTYYVHRRMPGWVEEATVEVRRGETRSVLKEDFTSVSYASTASRGELRRQVRRAQQPDLSLRFVMGVRGTLAADSLASRYIGSVAIGGFQARWLTRRTTYWGVDVLAGRGQTTLQFNGLAPVRTVLGTTTIAAESGIASRPATFRAGIGARAGMTWFNREFPDWEVPRQSEANLMTGANAWLGLFRGRFSVDIQYNFALLITTWDGGNFPTYSDLVVAGGYRF